MAAQHVDRKHVFFERSPSGRAKCRHCGLVIARGATRSLSNKRGRAGLSVVERVYALQIVFFFEFVQGQFSDPRQTSYQYWTCPSGMFSIDERQKGVYSYGCVLFTFCFCYQNSTKF